MSATANMGLMRFTVVVPIEEIILFANVENLGRRYAVPRIFLLGDSFVFSLKFTE
jgi:hypothetical protein